MDILIFLGGSACGFFIGASTVAMFCINGRDWGEPEEPEHSADHADIPDYLKRQAE